MLDLKLFYPIDNQKKRGAVMQAAPQVLNTNINFEIEFVVY
jgi:hypothetical protein